MKLSHFWDRWKEESWREGSGFLVFGLIEGRARNCFALVASALLIWSAWSLVGKFWADALAQAYQDPEGYRAALGTNPNDPSILHNLALLYMYDPLELDVARAQVVLERALRISPYDVTLWLDYARVMERQGLPDRAIWSCQAAIALAPSHFQPRWVYANTLLRARDSDRAYPILAELVERNGDALENVFELVWESSGRNPLTMLTFARNLHGVQERAALISFLMRRSQFDAAIAIWEDVAGSPEVFRGSGSRLMAGLLQTREWLRASRVFQEWSARSNIHELVWNGDMEREIAEAELDWRVLSAPGVRARQDDRMAHSGKRSLTLEFTGESRGHYAGVTHYLPVNPNSQYELSFQYKTAQLTPGGGVVVKLQDPRDSSLAWICDPIKASEEWSMRKIRLRTGRESHWLLLSIERMPSPGLFDYVSGQIWFDDFELVPIGSVEGFR